MRSNRWQTERRTFGNVPDDQERVIGKAPLEVVMVPPHEKIGEG